MDKGNIQHRMHFNTLDNERSRKHLAQLTVFLKTVLLRSINFDA